MNWSSPFLLIVSVFDNQSLSYEDECDIFGAEGIGLIDHQASLHALQRATL